MKERYIDCRYGYFVDRPFNIRVTVLEFIISGIIIVSGLIFNHKFFASLREERRNRPIGRKGNVIEPLMSWFCVFQMIYWPFDLLFMWVNTNGLVSSYQMPTWLLYFFYEPIRFGRTYLACNSIFVAVIRYLYIVHDQKLNQYQFKNVAKLFQAISIGIPIALETICLFTLSANFCKWKVLNDNPVEFGNTSEFIQKETVEWTLKYVPEKVVTAMAIFYLTAKVLIVSNLLEGYLYVKIFRSIHR